MRLPLTEIAAWSGTLVSHRVPPTGFSTTGVSSRGPAPMVNSRRSISWPGRTTDNVCLPCAAFSEHGVERSEEHTSELQSLRHLVCRLLLEKKKRQKMENNKGLDFIHPSTNLHRNILS